MLLAPNSQGWWARWSREWLPRFCRLFCAKLALVFMTLNGGCHQKIYHIIGRRRILMTWYEWSLNTLVSYGDLRVEFQNHQYQWLWDSHSMHWRLPLKTVSWQSHQMLLEHSRFNWWRWRRQSCSFCTGLGGDTSMCCDVAAVADGGMSAHNDMTDGWCSRDHSCCSTLFGSILVWLW